MIKNKLIPANVARVLLVAWVLVMVNALASLLVPAPNCTAGPLELPGYPYPGVTVEATWPRTLLPWETTAQPRPVTVFVAPRRPDADSVSLVVTPADRSVVVLDGPGRVLSGPVMVPLAYPAESAVTLSIATTGSGHAGFLSSHTVPIRLEVLNGGVLEPVDGLDMRVRLSSGLSVALLRANEFVNRYALPLLALLTLIALVVGALQGRKSAATRDAHLVLDERYVRARELIEAGQIEQARQVIDALRRDAPGYTRVDHLEALVMGWDGSSVQVAADPEAADDASCAERGIQAYKARNWAAACPLLEKACERDPFSPNLRFLYRTGCLYLELSGRDRSKRIAALRELGEIGDLVDLVPLVNALDDASAPVANAAGDALLAIGPPAFEALVGGLRSSSQRVRERAQSVLARFGPDVRQQLLELLRVKDAGLVAIAAQLLISLGAREQLAEALLWAAPATLGGISRALVSDEIVAFQSLLDVLLRAPEDRQPYVLAAIGDLKQHVSIERRIEELQRSTRDPGQRALLVQALRIKAGDFEDGLMETIQTGRQMATAD